MISFGYWVRRQRKALDLTQQALADRAGCSLAAIKKIEQDERRPSRQIAELLADALGVSGNQREMFLDVARGLRSLDQLLLEREAATATTVQPNQLFQHNLPIQLTSFIGREKEIAEVIILFEKARLVTLTGPGGTGKTRLAIQVANQLLNQYPDGLWLVELAPLNDSSLIPQTIASVFELREAPNISLMDMLINYLRAKQFLLILDNCEHLVEACARRADTLLHACPNMRILATSREALGIAGETLYLVPSLTRPDIRNLPAFESLDQYEAIQLFTDRATSAISTFTLTEENASSITQICQRLDGIPLAIELAASKIRALSASQIAQRLDDRFHLLTGGSRTALPRHQTLHAAIEWSYDLLSDEERRWFRQLSVFAGGWTFEAAEAICSDLDTPSLLTQLVNKSLVMAEERGERKRYRLLETIRQYAHEKLFASGEAQQIRDRHLVFYLRFAEAAEPRLRSGEQIVWIERVEAEYDNLRAALDWSLEIGNSNHALRLGGALGYFWEFRGDAREGYKWLDEALALATREQGRTVTAAQYAKALYANGRLHFLTFFDPTKGRTRIEESLHISREIGDLWQMAIALEHLGWVAVLEGDVQTARTRLEEGILLSRELEDRWPLALCLLRLASPLMRTDAPLAQRSAEEGVMLARGLGDLYLLIYGLTQLASAYFMNGNYADAARTLEEVLVKAPLIGGAYTNLSLFFLVVLTSLLGDSTRAKNYCFQLLTQVRETGFAIGTALIALGWLAGYSGQLLASVQLLAAAEIAFHQSSMNLSTYGGPILMIYKQALEKAQAQLDPAAFQTAWAEGQRMAIEQALALATESVLNKQVHGN